MAVLLWQNLLVRDWLHRGVVVMLMNLSIYSLGGFLMSVRLDCFAGDSWVDTLIDSLHESVWTKCDNMFTYRVMVTCLADEGLDGVLC